jgi:hypothetical protein
MTMPHPFKPGMRVLVDWRDRELRVLRRVTTSPLERRDLQPHPDAGWTGYGPRG